MHVVVGAIRFIVPGGVLDILSVRPSVRVLNKKKDPRLMRTVRRQNLVGLVTARVTTQYIRAAVVCGRVVPYSIALKLCKIAFQLMIMQ
jgi:hypothetical protein